MLAPDTHFYVNDHDPDLKAIRVDINALIIKNARFWNQSITDTELASLINPNPKKIRGYGKKPEQQYWTRQAVPDKLQKIEKHFGGDQKKIWDYVTLNKKDYEKEIEFIKKQWFHRIYGEWIYINGKATWINPWHWFFLTYWSGKYEVIDRKTLKKRSARYGEYRDRDRRKFHYYLYAYTCTETFANLDEDGNAIPEPDGTYKMVDTGSRTCFGVNYPKHRRDGATQNVLSIQYQVTTQVQQLYSSIIANKPNTQKKHFDTKVIPAWRRMPFFFKPFHDGSERPKRELNFIHPASKQKDGAINFNTENELESLLDFADVIDRAYYDHDKITGILVMDECGKTTMLDVYEGYGTIKPAMSQGAGSTINPYAFCFAPSTTEEFEAGGGANYKMLCDGSNYYQRNKTTGQTQTGLWNLFLSSVDGLENFIGPYGESVMERPNAEQQKFIARGYGAKEFIAAKIEEYTRQNTPKALAAREQFIRQHPITYADCWKMQGGDLGFNMQKLHDRHTELKRLLATGKDIRKKAYFVWMVPGEPHAIRAEEYLERKFHLFNNHSHRVELRFAGEDESFDFYISKTLEATQTNLKRWNQDKGYWELINEPTFIASADPVQYLSDMEAERREDKAKASYAAAACFHLYQTSDDAKLEHEKETNRFVCSYLSKDDDTDVHGEKMLMMCIYFNAEFFPEKNVKEAVRHFEKRLYHGFLKRAWLPEEGRLAPYVGYQSQGKMLNSLFRSVKDYIEFHIYKENHIEIIEQYIKIKSKAQMTSFDLFPASGGCLLGQKMTFVQVEDREYGSLPENSFNINDYFH